MNYVQLRAAVTNWMHRGDLEADGMIPTLIQLAEARIKRELRLMRLATVATVTITTGSAAGALPADYLEGMSVTGVDGDWTLVTPERFGQLSAIGGGYRDYTVMGGQILLPAVVTSDVVLSLAYFQALPALVADGDTNWLLTEQPGAYLWPTLCEAATFVRNAEAKAGFEVEAQRAFDQVRQADTGAAWFAASLPMPQGGV